jgi:hypothetical protein
VTAFSSCSCALSDIGNTRDNTSRHIIAFEQYLVFISFTSLSDIDAPIRNKQQKECAFLPLEEEYHNLML